MLKVKLLDGSFATQVAKHAVKDIDGHPLWSSLYLCTEPDSCVEAHRDFIRAGVDIITTNSYQANIESLIHMGLSHSEAFDIIQKSVKLVKFTLEQENKSEIQIAGSIGPYGTVLQDGSEYNGSYVDTMTEEDIINWHRPKFEALVKAGVDYLAIETIPSEKEGIALAKLLKEFPQQKAWLSFSCKDDEHVSHGESLSTAVKNCLELNSLQIVMVGVNCIRPCYVSKLIKRIKSVHPNIHTIAYPNKGGTWNSETMKWTEQREEKSILEYVSQWLEEGVNIIGGCCEISSQEIAQIRTLIDEFNDRKNK